MFIIGLMSIVGSTEALTGFTEETLASLPYYSYLIPMLLCTIVVLIGSLIALILFL